MPPDHGNPERGNDMTANATYRMLKIQDPRSPGFFWFEIECRDGATGQTHTVAVCDTRSEAQATIKAMRAAVRS